MIVRLTAAHDPIRTWFAMGDSSPSENEFKRFSLSIFVVSCWTFQLRNIWEEVWMNKSFAGAILIALASSAMAQDAMKVVKPDGLTWIEHPVFRGAQTALLIGDLTKAETIVQRVKFPPNYKVPPHTHPYAEVVTVMSGSFGNAMGEKFDPSKGEILKPGSVFTLPAKHPHYVWTTNEETMVQIVFTGPGGIVFIDPADDPRKK
ncbi:MULTISPECIES: cupin domain-containing protein [unclassified Bradyrhizobium]|uniref:cupin domain-containing protein n=1 Tax=unclassified Bradyrhizobium TaxID=2631580 RepID=UPI0017DD8DB6|nr:MULTISPECIES: cupin domain-containing protein [unclassified Bradyrhizobium]MBB4259906.1 quercetin dioxygenase-like cupin family protein [Bradyrhizobium sp. CIR3A]NYG49569.1 quercetin dioxygenase-like cupin family protein [Bradyrhizobium sp. IAR9]